MSRPHVWKPGTGSPPLLLLHGTGGDEQEIFWLHEAIAPASPALSVRGAVLEGDMARFFARKAEGVLDEDDLRFRVDELAEFLIEVEQSTSVASSAWVAVGFSNGANMAAAMLWRLPELLSGAVLFAAMLPFQDEPVGGDLTGKTVVISNGRNDPVIPDQTAELVERLRGAGATVTELPHDGGHEIDRRLIPRVGELIGVQS